MPLPRRSPPDRRAARLLALSTATHQSHGAPHGDTGVLALDRALEAQPSDVLLGAPSAATAWLRDAVRILCAEARAADPVRAERLLIALREQWHGLPAIRHIPDLGVRRALWERVVALCVEEFYAPTPAPHVTPARPAVATSAA